MAAHTVLLFGLHVSCCITPVVRPTSRPTNSVTHLRTRLPLPWSSWPVPPWLCVQRGGGGGSNGAPPRATPDATLVGHEADALFPLATAAPAPLVASGGADKLLLLWDLGDLGDTSLTATAAAPRPGGGTKLQPRCVGVCVGVYVCRRVACSQ